MITERIGEPRWVSLNRGRILIPSRDWGQIWKKGSSFRRIDENPQEAACAPCVGVAAVIPCNGSARMDSQPELAAEPAVLGLRSADTDAELGEGKTGVTLWWKL
jgi:hypothetical protein